MSNSMLVLGYCKVLTRVNETPRPCGMCLQAIEAGELFLFTESVILHLNCSPEWFRRAYEAINTLTDEPALSDRQLGTTYDEIVSALKQVRQEEDAGIHPDP